MFRRILTWLAENFGPAATPEEAAAIKLWPHQAKAIAAIEAGDTPYGPGPARAWAAAVTPGSKPSRWANLVKGLFDSYGIEGAEPPAIHSTPESELLHKQTLVMWGDMTLDERVWATHLLKARGYDIVRDRHGRRVTSPPPASPPPASAS